MSVHKFSVLLVAAAGGLLACASASAQLYGEDQVGALKGQVNRSMQQSQAYIDNMVWQAMNDPECYAAYQGAIANGLQETYTQFAYGWVLTAHYTTEGYDTFARSEAEMRRHQMQVGPLLQNAPQE